MMTSSLIVYIIDLCRPIFSNFLLFFRWWDIYHIYNTETTDSSDHKAWRSLKINSRFLFSKAINYKTILLHIKKTNSQSTHQHTLCPTNPKPNPKPQPRNPNHKPQPNLTLTSPNPTPWCCSLQRGTRCRMCSASNSFLLRQPSVAVAAPDSASRWNFSPKSVGVMGSPPYLPITVFFWGPQIAMAC